MKLLRYGAGLLFSLCLVPQVHAVDDWLDLGTAANKEYRVYLNFPNLKEQEYLGKTYVLAWTKWVVLADRTHDGLSIGDYRVGLARYDCSEHKSGIVSMNSYKKNGHVLGQSYTPTYVNMEYTIPDSIGDFILKAACYANEVKQGRISPEGNTDGSVN
ncbi:surface-adhesin E family protein [Acinetobacter brisouii]